jgi:hypothetical protein
MGQHKTIKKLTTKAAERAKTKPLLPAGSMKLVNANLKIMKGKITKAVVNKEQQRAEFTIETDSMQANVEQEGKTIGTLYTRDKGLMALLRGEYKADAGAPGFSNFGYKLYDDIGKTR